MVNKIEHLEIGYTKKVHGLNGELKVFINDRYLEDFVLSKCIFIELNGSPVPYFPENIRLGNEILIKLEDVTDVGTARILQSKKVYLDSNALLKPNERKIQIKGEKYLDLEGYKMQTVEGYLLGEVIELIDMPSQKMAVVNIEGEDKMIPLNEYFVKEISREKCLIIVDLPEGLLDL